MIQHDFQPIRLLVERDDDLIFIRGSLDFNSGVLIHKHPEFDDCLTFVMPNGAAYALEDSTYQPDLKCWTYVRLYTGGGEFVGAMVNALRMHMLTESLIPDCVELEIGDESIVIQGDSKSFNPSTSGHQVFRPPFKYDNPN